MQDLYDFLESDRQWRRSERILHAQYKRRTAADPKDKAFWRLVLKANGYYDKDQAPYAYHRWGSTKEG